MTKVCTKCGVEKELGEFRAGRGKAGHRAQCRACEKAYGAAYRQRADVKVRYQKWAEENPDRIKAARRRYNRRHPEVVQKAKEKFREENPTYHAEYSLKQTYGITLVEYDEMLAMQDGVCAICGGQQTGEPGRRFDVDHDHKTGEVRGLLCNRCNQAIGLLDDSSEVTLKAALYLSENGR